MSFGIWRFGGHAPRARHDSGAHAGIPAAALAFWGAGLASACLLFAIWWTGLRDAGETAGLTLPNISLIVLAAGGAMLATVLPISMSGIGVYEAVGVALLGLTGVTPEHALLAALIVRAVVMLSSLVGLPSAILLWRMRSG